MHQCEGWQHVSVQKLKIKPVNLGSREDVFKSQSNQAGDQAPKRDSQRHQSVSSRGNSMWRNVFCDAGVQAWGIP